MMGLCKKDVVYIIPLAADYDNLIQDELKRADPEVSPGLWEGDIAGLEPEVSL